MAQAKFRVCNREYSKIHIYEGVTKSFQMGRLEQEMQMLQLSDPRCSRIDILWVSLVSFATITLCVASQQVFIVVHFVIDSVRKILDTHARARVCVCKGKGKGKVDPAFN
jgi:hypothetical protein